ncbi:MAG: nucleotidyl transferase AbiEii/AbiGii toxin family protein [Bacteriovorax sp.]
MIPRRYIEEWKEHAPWPDDAQVEQDLVICRALVEIFNDDVLAKKLAFRGGTALHKLYLKPQARYSEDIDLVQIEPGPIGEILDRLREALKFIPGKASFDKGDKMITLQYRFDSEIPPVVNMRLKIETNCREHFTELGLKKMEFEVNSGWFNGKCNITTYEIEELLGTKLRALYQRSKGRDLFDLFWAYQHHNIDTTKLLKCYHKYMGFSVENPPSSKEFILNMEEKMKDRDFTEDIHVILRSEIEYDNHKAYELVNKELLENI